MLYVCNVLTMVLWNSLKVLHSQSAGQPQFSDQNDVCQQYNSLEGKKRSSVTQRHYFRIPNIWQLLMKGQFEECDVLWSP